MLAEEARAAKQGGQELVGGLDVRVLRNRYGTQIQSFVADLQLPFLGEAEPPFRGIFIRAPVVEEIELSKFGGQELQENTKGIKKKPEPVEVLGVFKSPSNGPGKGEETEQKEQEEEDIVAVRQGNVFGTSFHPELTGDTRIHIWWLKQVLDTTRHGDLVTTA
jgi:pyridoxal 5'-phosphate synthase pdxT subunit